MKDEFSKKPRRQLFTPIPVPKLNERYWIDVQYAKGEEGSTTIERVDGEKDSIE